MGLLDISQHLIGLQLLAFGELIKNNKDLRIIIIGAEKKLLKIIKILFIEIIILKMKKSFMKKYIGLNT